MRIDILEHSDSRLTHSQKRLIESVHSLHSVYEMLDSDSDLLAESLSTGKMSDFLFEADEKAVVKSTREAMDATKTNLEELEQAGKDLNNSKAIQAVVDQLRKKLVEIELDLGAFASLKDFAGHNVKQLTFIGNGIAQASGDIKTAVESMMSALDTLKIDVKDPAKRNKKLSALIEAESERTKVDSKKFMDGIKQKIGASSKGGNFFSDAFKSIVGMFKGVKPVKLDANLFADELTDCTPTNIDTYLKGPSHAAMENPSTGDVAAPLKSITTSADIKDPATLASTPGPGAAPKAGESGVKRKIPKKTAESELAAKIAEMGPDAEKESGRIASAIVNAPELADMFEGRSRQNISLHRRSLVGLLFEALDPNLGVKLQQVIAKFVPDKSGAERVWIRTVEYLRDKGLLNYTEAKDAVDSVSPKTLKAVAAEARGASTGASEEISAVDAAASKPDTLGKALKSSIEAISKANQGKAYKEVLDRSLQIIASELQSGMDDTLVNDFEQIVNNAFMKLEDDREISGQISNMFGDANQFNSLKKSFVELFKKNLKLENKRIMHASQRVISEQFVNSQVNSLSTSRWARLAGIRDED